ncbi:MAG: tRNA uridine-5-carboxymethylaminomethyl(34) synthesis GTPase MnmE, partial [Candidatus Sumerlaeaceae bacterium]|nr:tRNA uridine-5-carboxymethylaminomethyl(34) synthesis GTPase MnmE [Candidatus Sumerlaeaceae bacterium]
MRSTMHYDGENDTIVAPATVFGRGAIGIVRLSGNQALSILTLLYRTVSGKTRSSFDSHRLYYGRLIAPDGQLLDECLAVAMHAPRSYTGEDVVEFHVHASPAVAQSVIDACLALGCRLARPGEFTLRAYLNGRLELAQAEGIANLIAAQTTLSQRIALQQLAGGVSEKINQLRELLLDATAELEAWIDFPEEEISQPAQEKHEEMLARVAQELRSLLNTHGFAKTALEGARVVLIGVPNAGKSSLFNALVGRERAIVTPHPGTTRDTIEAIVDVRGVPVTLVDTAGLRETENDVEAIGIRRSLEEANRADLVVWVADPTTHRDQEVKDKIHAICDEARLVAVINKIDVAEKTDIDSLAELLNRHGWCVVKVSCVTREGLDELEQALYERLGGKVDALEGICIATARHADCLKKALG